MFARLAIDSYGATKTTLARFDVHFPNWGSVFIMGVNVPKAMTEMADTNNANVSALEKSIRESASLTFRLNLLSAFMAVVGLAAQISVYRQDARQNRKRERVIDGES